MNERHKDIGTIRILEVYHVHAGNNAKADCLTSFAVPAPL